MKIIEIVKRTYVGEFEELVLLTVAVMEGNAYGIAIMHEMVAQTGRDLRLNQVHSALLRLEDKGMLKIFTWRAHRRARRKKKTPFCSKCLWSPYVVGNSGSAGKFLESAY